MAIEQRLMTLEEYELLPDDGFRHQLIDGVLLTMPPASFRHGEVAATIARHLGNYVVPRRLARVATNDPNHVLQRGPDTVLAPDVSVVLSSRVPPEGMPLRPTAIVPDIAVEVRSPSDTRRYIEEKRRRWLAAGVQIVWNVDIRAETIAAHYPDGTSRLFTIDDTLDAEPVLPGFAVPVRELFA